MAEKIISVKTGKIVEKDGKDWIELVDQEDKTHRIFRSIQNNEGAWVHLDKEVDMLKGKIEDGSIEGLALKLIKEKKGQYWNVTGVELVTEIFKKEAIKEIANDRDARIEAQVAIKEIGECWRAGKMQDDDPFVMAYKDWIFDKLKGGQSEIPKMHQNSETSNQPEDEGQVSEQGGGAATDEEEQFTRIRQLGMDLGWGQKKAKEHMKSLFGKEKLSELTQEELDALERNLHAIGIEP